MRNCSVKSIYRVSKPVMNKPEQVKTPEQVKAEFARQGITTTGWARDHGFPPREVILVLNGYYKCNYGRAHKIAVALGLKPSADDDSVDRRAA